MKKAIALVLFCQSVVGIANEAVLKGYHRVSTELAADRYASAKEEAAKLSAVFEPAAALSRTENPTEQRRAYGPLSEAVVKLLKAEPALQPQWQAYFCPMAEVYGYWVQPKGEKMANPYMGLEMLTCGVRKKWEAIP